MKFYPLLASLFAGLHSRTALVCCFVVGLGLFDACRPGSACICPAFLPYYTFTELQKPSVLVNPPDAGYRFYVRLDSVYFTVQNDERSLGNPFSSQLYACDCAYDGYLGLKSPILSFDLTADAPFNDTIPAGKFLANYCKAISSQSLQAFEPFPDGYASPLNDMNLLQPFRFGSTSEQVAINLAIEPNLVPAQGIRFTIWMRTADSTVHKVVTDPVF